MKMCFPNRLMIVAIQSELTPVSTYAASTYCIHMNVYWRIPCFVVGIYFHHWAVKATSQNCRIVRILPKGCQVTVLFLLHHRLILRGYPGVQARVSLLEVRRQVRLVKARPVSAAYNTTYFMQNRSTKTKSKLSQHFYICFLYST